MFGRLTRALRAGVSAFRAGHDVAGGSGRWDKGEMLWSPVSQSLAARSIASKRVSYLTENSPIGSAILTAWVNALCGGDSITARSAHSDPATRSELENRWADFGADCDAEGLINLQGLVGRVARSLVNAGEAFVRLVVDPSTMRLRLQLLSPEQIDSGYSPSLGMTGAYPNIVAGVERNAAGQVVAFYVRPAPDAPFPTLALEPVRVDASDCLHIFEPRFPGQVRGMPWLSAVATTLRELDALVDAAQAKAKVSCLLAGFITDVDGSSGLAREASANGLDPASLSLEPGTLRVLPPGVGIQFSPTSDMASLEGVLRYMTKCAAAGAGVPFESASGDLSETNYSSARVGQENFKRAVRMKQQTLLVGQLLAPIWRRFVLLEILSGRMRAPDFEDRPASYNNVEFFFSGWSAIDELKAAKAQTLLLNSRLRSRAELIAEAGRDISDVDREIEDDPLMPDLTASAGNIVTQPDMEGASNA